MVLCVELGNPYRMPVRKGNLKMARSVMRTTLGQQYVKGFAPDAINREVNDFYSTPSVMTEALLSVEKFEGSVGSLRVVMVQ